MLNITLIIREMKIKIRNQNHSTFITMTKLKKKKKRLTIPNAGKMWSIRAGENATRHSHFGRQCDRFLKCLPHFIHRNYIQVDYNSTIKGKTAWLLNG